jgi:hypothetical protein
MESCHAAHDMRLVPSRWQQAQPAQLNCAGSTAAGSLLLLCRRLLLDQQPCNDSTQKDIVLTQVGDVTNKAA